MERCVKDHLLDEQYKDGCSTVKEVNGPGFDVPWHLVELVKSQNKLDTSDLDSAVVVFLLMGIMR